MCCEANIARWIAALQLLGPVTAEEIVSKLVDAIERQDAFLRSAWEPSEPFFRPSTEV